MKKKNFSHRITMLHDEIVREITLLMGTTLERMWFLGDKTANVCFDREGTVSCDKVNGVGYIDGEVMAHIRDAESNENEWERISLSGDAIYCTIDELYNLLFEAVQTCCGTFSFSYNSVMYNFRYVQPRDIGIDLDVPDGVVLIGPKALEECLKAGNELDGVLDRSVYYYTDEMNLRLPYPKLCEALIAEGID